MRLRAVVNIVLNTMSIVVAMVAGLLVMPFLIMHLGSETYGLWSLIATMTGYYSVLDLGLSGAVGRFVARYHAQHDLAAINEVMSTGFALLMVVCVVALLLTIGAAQLFPLIFHVPPSQRTDVYVAVALVGLNLALMFPFAVFSGFLWGHERFDLLNFVDIPAVILRAAVTLWLLGDAERPLVLLGLIVLANGLSVALIKTIFCFSIEPRLRISPRLVRRRQVGELCSFGGWMSLIFWARTLTPQIAPTFIGNQLGAAAVTTFVVARQLVAYINSFTITATQVFAPRAVALHAKNAQEEQRNLLILGGRFSVALALFFLGGVTAYGEPFIHSWQRGSQDSAIPLLVILYLGELVPISQWITYSVILGMNKQRVLGLLSLLEVVSTAIVTLTILMLNQNLQFIAAGIAVSASVTRGACYGVYGCRLVGVTLREYLAKVAVPVALVACVPIAVLLIANSILRPDSVRSVIMGGVLYTAIFWLFLVPAILGTDGTKELFRSVLGARPRHQLP